MIGQDFDIILSREFKTFISTAPFTLRPSGLFECTYYGIVFITSRYSHYVVTAWLRGSSQGERASSLRHETSLVCAGKAIRISWAPSAAPRRVVLQLDRDLRQLDANVLARALRQIPLVQEAALGSTHA